MASATVFQVAYPSTRGKEAAPAESVIPRAQEIFDRLEDQRERFLATVDALSPEQRHFRAHQRAWCVLEVGHHVVLAEQRTASAVKRHRGMQSGKRRLRDRIGKALLWTVLKTGLRVKNPVPEAAPDRDISREQLEAAWERARSELRAFLEALQEAELKDAAYKHPIAGPFNVEESMVFLVGHLDHHLRQIDRIQQHPEFPRS